MYEDSNRWKKIIVTLNVDPNVIEENLTTEKHIIVIDNKVKAIEAKGTHELKPSIENSM
jgi:hypothetical protein